MTGRGNLDVSLNIRLRKSGDGARATEAELKRLRDATKGIDTAGSGKLQRELRAAGTAARTAAGDVKRVADGAKALDAGGGAQRLAGGLAAAGKEARRAADSVRAVDANMAKLARFGEGGLPMSMKALAEHAAQVESHLKGAATAQERLTRAQAKGAATPAGGVTPPPGPNPAGSGRPHPAGSSRTAVMSPGYIAPVGAAYGGKRMLDQSIGFEKAFA
ncbi:hypothetical protein KL771_28175, partial [Hyphomicrobiaceae bacterium 22]|nr:hypothetical protein [Prosthecodimorpha staleyi]